MSSKTFASPKHIRLCIFYAYVGYIVWVRCLCAFNVEWNVVLSSHNYFKNLSARVSEAKASWKFYFKYMSCLYQITSPDSYLCHSSCSLQMKHFTRQKYFPSFPFCWAHDIKENHPKGFDRRQEKLLQTKQRGNPFGEMKKKIPFWWLKSIHLCIKKLIFQN